MPDEKIADLIERVERASGEDRELDLALARALVPDVIVLRQRKDNSGADPYTYWHYTGSLDAALALVERMRPGSGIELIYDAAFDTWNCAVLPLARPELDGASSRFGEERQTAPLAVLSALLRSIQAT